MVVFGIGKRKLLFLILRSAVSATYAHKMELRHLRYFVIVAKELNYRRAAEILHVAHPSLSKQIKDLEYELDVRLFDRNTKGVKLTSAGHVFLEQALGVLAKAEEGVFAARGAAAGKSGKLSIGHVGPMSAEFLPTALSLFLQKHPNVDINLQEIDPTDQIAHLETKNIQVAFTFNDPSDVVPAHMDHMVLMNTEPVILMSDKNELAHKTQITPQELAQQTIICFSTTSESIDHAAKVKDLFDLYGLTPKPFKRAGSYDTLFTMALCNHGVIVAPKLSKIKPPQGLVARPLVQTTTDYRIELRAVWSRDENSVNVINFLEILKKSLPEPKKLFSKAK